MRQNNSITPKNVGLMSAAAFAAFGLGVFVADTFSRSDNWGLQDVFAQTFSFLCLNVTDTIHSEACKNFAATLAVSGANLTWGMGIGGGLMAISFGVGMSLFCCANKNKAEETLLIPSNIQVMDL